MPGYVGGVVISEADTGPALVQVSDIRCFFGQDYWDPFTTVAGRIDPVRRPGLHPLMVVVRFSLRSVLEDLPLTRLNAVACT